MPDLKSELAKLGNDKRPVHHRHDAANDQKEKRERKSRMIPIQHLETYCKMVGRAEAAEQMGLTQSGLATMFERRMCSPMYEKFADALIRELIREKDDEVVKPTLFCVTVPAEKTDAFCTLATAMELNVKVLDIG